jgi:hypothetical protein
MQIYIQTNPVICPSRPQPLATTRTAWSAGCLGHPGCRTSEIRDAGCEGWFGMGMGTWGTHEPQTGERGRIQRSRRGWLTMRGAGTWGTTKLQRNYTCDNCHAVELKRSGRWAPCGRPHLANLAVAIGVQWQHLMPERRVLRASPGQESHRVAGTFPRGPNDLIFRSARHRDLTF